MLSTIFTGQRMRGFYFDFGERPGPTVHTVDDFIGAIENIGSYWDTYESTYRKFEDKFTLLDDGHSAERVIERVFVQGRLAAAVPASHEEVRR